MSQSQVSDFNIDPTTTTGTQLAQILNRLSDAGITCHSGAARPPYSKTGTIWLDTSTPPGTLYWFDGVIDNPLGGGGGLSWSVAAGSATGAGGDGYMVDTTGGAVTMTLPAGAAGDRIGFKDYAGNFDTNALTITPAAGENIEGKATPLIIDNQGWGGVLEYIDATKGWMLVESSPMGAWGTGSLVPAGGAANQVLSKIDGTDGNVQWTDTAVQVPTPGVDVTGNVNGLEYDQTGAHEVTIKKGDCMDSTNQVALQLTTDTPLTIGTTANAMYQLFIVKETGTGNIIVKADTNVDGSGLTGVDNFRWIGYVLNNASGALYRQRCVGNKLEFLDRVDGPAPGTTTHKRIVIGGLLVPSGRYEEYMMACIAKNRQPTQAAPDWNGVKGEIMYYLQTTLGGVFCDCFFSSDAFWVLASGPPRLQFVRLKR